MEYVLYVPGMSFNGETLARGVSLGGSESAGFYLARELAARGHEVTVFSRIAPEQAGRWEGVGYRPIGALSEGTPLGAAFQQFAAAVPHDVLLGQRLPALFSGPLAAKVRLWWTHDLALRRNLPAFSRQVWNLNGALCVSEFHKTQLAEVYGLPPERIHVAPNGVDPALFRAPAAEGAGSGDVAGGAEGAHGPRATDAAAKRSGRVLFYSSRPERGLEHLVGLGGDDPAGPAIMERLLAADPSITLQVCGYDNTAPELAGYYARLAARCRALPNVEWLGPLSKEALARRMEAAWLHVYPTQFEEVSCITAMEAQCAGTPVLTTPLAALPETLRDAGVHWIPLAEGGGVEREAYARAILALRDDPERYGRLHRNALDKAPAYRWCHAADTVERVVADTLARGSGEPGRLARHLMRLSDIGALRAHLSSPTFLAALPAPSSAGAPGKPGGALLERTRAELAECYGFAERGAFARHYADYYAREQARGVVYGPESLEGQPRFEAVARHVAMVASGGVVLDYGCAHGHYTVNLARRFPHLRFIGMDLVASNVETARAWARDEGLDNAGFLAGTLAENGEGLPPLALAIAAEVLEHVPEPAALADALAARLEPGGSMVLTTPYGPWEAQGYAEHHPWRAHLHHLERADLIALFGRHPGFSLQAVPAGPDPAGEALGSWVTVFRKPAAPSGAVDYPAKLRRQAPRETLSVCMVVRPESDLLARCLRSVAPLADELILGIDTGDEDRTSNATCGDNEAGAAGRQTGSAARHRGEGGGAWALAGQCGAQAFALPSPLREGFDAARNATIDRAAGDWILWIDDDEELLWPERLPKYLRDNAYDAYALKQHHFAVEPGGVIKTDFPCRLFRNRRGFRFYGLVHEHPELGLNRGAGRVLLLPDVAICHGGYLTEEVRRARFARNLPLMRRDRERHPERLLGRFLWIRDLAHLNRFEFERAGAVSPAMRERAREAVTLWRGLLDDGQPRMALDALPYYSEAAGLLAGNGIDFSLQLELHCLGLGDPNGQPGTTVQGRFLEPADIERLTAALLKEKIGAVEGKYV